ncbi:MAG TPA: inositol monophosphatase family protein [Pirellulaceae bacterium]|nr:inositol monophosphatase family protein [Pirellulaceae bacterium]
MTNIELNVAQQAARAGGEVVARYFRDGVTMRHKESYNLVSDADVEAEQAIVRTIRAAFPGHSVLAEEAHRDSVDAEHLWIIDPLDGTNNFAHQIPQFAVSVAYYRQGRPQCGVVFDPVREQWYVAAAGKGAYHNGQRVSVGTENQLQQILVGVGFYYDRGKIMEATLEAIRDLFHSNIHGIRRFGAASLDLCWVGLGRFGAFFEYELSPWDFAAGRLFVEEAGGKVTTCHGGPLPIAKSSILATNACLHDEVLSVVRRHCP